MSGLNIAPRNNEIKAVVDLLEDDSFADAKSLARAIVKAVWLELLERDFYAPAWRTGPASQLVLAWGPLTSEKEAERFVRDVHLGGDWIVKRLNSPANQSRQDKAVVAAVELRDGAWCGHPNHTHQHTGYGGKCAAGKCNCREFKEQEEAA